MKSYLLLFRGGLTPDESPALWQEQMQEWGKWMDELGRSGKLTGGLQVRKDGRILSKDKDQIIDKPYTPYKESMGGFLTLKAKDRAEAIEMAGGCPIFKYDGTCELSEIIEQ